MHFRAEYDQAFFSMHFACMHNAGESLYSETLNNEYIERIYQMSYSSLSDNGMLQIYSFLIKGLYGTL